VSPNEPIPSYWDTRHAIRKTVQEMSTRFDEDDREALERVATEHCAGTPSVRSFDVDGKTGKITSPNGVDDGDHIERMERTYAQIIARDGLRR
jgi:hypothetical protein